MAESSVKTLKQNLKMTKYSTSYNKSQNRYKKNVSIIPSYLTNDRLGPMSNFLLVFSFVSLMGLLYLSQVKRTGDFNYSISEVEAHQSQLQEDNRSLEVQAAKLKSLQRIRENVASENLVQPENVVRVKISNPVKSAE